MAEFYGAVQGSGGEVHRLGGKSSGLTTSAASWQGSVHVYLKLDENGRVLADVQLRGRWQALKSVARYAKPWAVLIAWAKLPPKVAKDALEMGRDPAAAWHDALATERALEPFL